MIPETLLGIFMIFCRVGGCLMVAPGLSSQRVAQRVRLFVALTVTLAVSPLLLPKFSAQLRDSVPADTLWWIGCETLTGLAIGFFGRAFYFALETMATALATMIGLGGIPGNPVAETEGASLAGSLITMGATILIFAMDLHWELFRGLVASYDRIPPGVPFGSGPMLAGFVDRISEAFVMAARITSPFVIYSVMVNLAMGLANKLTPQIPVFFIATPFVLFGGMLLLMFLYKDMIAQFILTYEHWLKWG
ncbi:MULTISPECIES: flagellar biosynthesis protein FliR [unclassified Methylobacterium]|jgi:flagellar biosynthetic protein FliR|uniref:flagellar biosynthesis protein FliR n=1 Tax=unclassified Methylobacterium TaxID=2615210 RepID=UPI001352E04A|nr:flagellar biosynthesis protein FliR [Methylobacterium sp. 2A]MWV25098.1 flagellar biosynthesis protein FliR [Methylobacterium sp. 2A]